MEEIMSLILKPLLSLFLSPFDPLILSSWLPHLIFFVSARTSQSSVTSFPFFIQGLETQ